LLCPARCRDAHCATRQGDASLAQTHTRSSQHLRVPALLAVCYRTARPVFRVHRLASSASRGTPSPVGATPVRYPSSPAACNSMTGQGGTSSAPVAVSATSPHPTSFPASKCPAQQYKTANTAPTVQYVRPAPSATLLQPMDRPALSTPAASKTASSATRQGNASKATLGTMLWGIRCTS
jgi:hypothetical protein